MDEEKLIETVRGFPCLWQVSCKGYKDVRAKENAWTEVATQVGESVSVEDCQRKWKTLRDHFVRELKKVKKKKTGTVGPCYVSCWPLFDQLLFLQDSVKHRQTNTNFSSVPAENLETQPEEESTDVELSLPSGPNSPNSSGTSSRCPSVDLTSPGSSSTSQQPPAKKRKKASKDDVVDEYIIQSLKNIEERRAQRQVGQEDEDELFGRQVAATLHRLANI